MRILVDVEETESSFAGAGVAPKGKLRVDMPGLIGTQIIMPQLDDFHPRHPGIQILIGFSDKPVDLIQDGVDCVIRVGALQDSSLVAKKLEHLLVSRQRAPSYIERHGIPTTIDDLSNHTREKASRREDGGALCLQRCRKLHKERGVGSRYHSNSTLYGFTVFEERPACRGSP